MSRWRALAGALALLGLWGCGSRGGEPLGREALRNALYRSEFVEQGTFRMIDGAYVEPVAVGAASELEIVLSDSVAYGDLDGDGRRDAAVILVTNPGGSGVFHDLAAVVDRRGVPRHVSSISLGDRVRFSGLAVDDGEIRLTVLQHAPDDPMCCPTLAGVERFRLVADSLVRLGP